MFFGQHRKVGAGHLGEPAVVDALRIRSDYPWWMGVAYADAIRPPIVNRFEIFIHVTTGRIGQYTHQLVGNEQCVIGMYQPGRRVVVADQILICLHITRVSGWITACCPPMARKANSPIDNSSPTCTVWHGAPGCPGLRTVARPGWSRAATATA